jgi:hypothetical protein
MVELLVPILLCSSNLTSFRSLAAHLGIIFSFRIYVCYSKFSCEEEPPCEEFLIIHHSYFLVNSNSFQTIIPHLVYFPPYFPPYPLSSPIDQEDLQYYNIFDFCFIKYSIPTHNKPTIR